MSHHVAHAVSDYITHELAILRHWCGIYRRSPEEFVRRHGFRFEGRHWQLAKTRAEASDSGAELRDWRVRFDRPSDRA